MRRLPVLLICLSALAGCAGRQVAPGWPEPSAGRYDFNWRLSGDRAVAPLQVFDDGRDTWLQFSPGQPLPAIFGVRGGGEQLLSYQRRDPYVRISGLWPQLMLRGGGLQAQARSLTRAEPGPGPSESHVAGLGGARGDAQAAIAGGMVDDAGAPNASAHARLTAQAVPVDAHAGASGKPAGTAAAQAEPGADRTKAAVVFDASPADVNMRRALARWATQAGWTFQPEHWAVDVDIPLTASAQFPADFKQAVRRLLGATELSDRPAQPCFYSNRVLRVVSWSEPCDRTVIAGAGT